MTLTSGWQLGRHSVRYVQHPHDRGMQYAGQSEDRRRNAQGEHPSILSETFNFGIIRLIVGNSDICSKQNILFNSIAPGFIETDLTLVNNNPTQIKELTERIPVGRLGHPIEIAKLVEFLGSPSNTYITGQTINIDGGFSLT
jgi:hypothetical protein